LRVAKIRHARITAAAAGGTTKMKANVFPLPIVVAVMMAVPLTATDVELILAATSAPMSPRTSSRAFLESAKA